MRRMSLLKAYLHKSKGVLDTGNTEALGKDDTHESGDSANGDAKKSRGSCRCGKVSDDEAWVGNKLAKLRRRKSGTFCKNTIWIITLEIFTLEKFHIFFRFFGNF